MRLASHVSLFHLCQLFANVLTAMGGYA